MNPAEIKIDPEFESHIAALSSAEFTQLEQNILQEGCRDALVVWKGENILLDGHNRYLVCESHGLPFAIIEKEFARREEALNWVIYNQLGRRNIDSANLSFLRGKLYNIQKKDKLDNLQQNQPGKKQHVITPLQASKGCNACLEHTVTDDGGIFCEDCEERINDRETGLTCSEWKTDQAQPKSTPKPNPTKKDSPVRTSDKVAEQFKVSHKTIEDDAKFAQSVDTIAGNVGPEARKTILSREKKISKTDTIAIATLPADEQVAAMELPEEEIARKAKEIREAQEKLKREQRVQKAAANRGDEDGRIVDSLAELVDEGVKFQCIYLAIQWSPLSVYDISVYPIAELLDEKAHVHLLVQAGHLADGLSFLEACGLTYTTELAWFWQNAQESEYWQVAHEIILLGIKGAAPFASTKYRSWVNDRESSSKAESLVRDILARVSPGPRLQIFGRSVSPGWTAFLPKGK